MTNQCAKFIPNLDNITAPLKHFLCKNTKEMCREQQELAFQQNLFLSPPVLAHYSPNWEMFIAADDSNIKIGAILH